VKFMSVRDLRTSTARLRKDLETDREVVITANGRPFAVLTQVDPDRLEEEVLAMRSSRARSALSRVRSGAKAKGLDRITPDRVDEIIAEVRRERRGRR
jgi:antitoxin (DNA-binding transcriptional repressor) of toxin-antitoxin stability system